MTTWLAKSTKLEGGKDRKFMGLKTICEDLWESVAYYFFSQSNLRESAAFGWEMGF